MNKFQNIISIILFGGIAIFLGLSLSASLYYHLFAPHILSNQVQDLTYESNRTLEIPDITVMSINKIDRGIRASQLVEAKFKVTDTNANTKNELLKNMLAARGYSSKEIKRGNHEYSVEGENSQFIVTIDTNDDVNFQLLIQENNILTRLHW